MNCETCQAKLPTVQSKLNRVNNRLHELGLVYHVFLPVYAIDAALVDNGFEATSVWAPGSNGDGSLHEEVGHGKWVTVTWHRMESGRWEVTAYVN